MHGLGNDFVVLDARSRALSPDRKRSVRAIADRRTRRRLRPVHRDRAARTQRRDAFMRIRNPDGSEAGACGNATRCVAHLLMERDRHALKSVIGTIAGLLPASVRDPAGG